MITPSLPTSFHESQFDGWSNRMPTIASIYSNHGLLPALAELYQLLRVTPSKEIVAVHVWNTPDQWHNWRVARVRTAFPVKLNVKTGPFLACISACSIYYSFGFSRLSFFRFSEYFPVISGFCIAVQYWIFNCFSTIFWVLACGLPSAKFPRGSNL